MFGKYQYCEYYMLKLFDVAKAVLGRKCIDLNTSVIQLEERKMSNERSNPLTMSGTYYAIKKHLVREEIREK